MTNARGVSAAQLRAWLAELPEFEERETWEHPTFRVRDRMFGSMDADGTSATFKASVEEQRALVAADPATFGVPAYVGKHGWVQVDLARVDPAELHEIAVEAWLRTAPRRTVRAWEASRQD
jgi:hypothetical protein